MPNDVPNSTYSQVDASNTSPVPNGAPEGWFPSDVNNWGRQVMGALKRFWVHLNPTATTAGTTVAYTLTYAVAPQQLWAGEIFTFTFNATCGADPTLNVNALGAKQLRRWNGSAWANLAAADAPANSVVQCFYNSAGSGTYDVISGLGTSPTGPAGGDLGGTYPNPTVLGKVPPGAWLPYGGFTEPPGYIFGDGVPRSRTTYATLFAVYGTAYGAGDGSTTFGIPDLRGRVIAGRDNMGGSAAGRLTNITVAPDGNALGATGGAQTHTLSIGEMPSHTHAPILSPNGAGSSGDPLSSGGGGPIVGSPTTATGGGGAHLNVQPTFVANFIIKT